MIGGAYREWVLFGWMLEFGVFYLAFGEMGESLGFGVDWKGPSFLGNLC